MYVSESSCLPRKVPNIIVNGLFIFSGNGIATSFFLGLLFAQLPYDYHVLWRPSSSTLFVQDQADGYALLENHLRLLHASPSIVPRILHIVISVGFLGFFIKLYKPSESNTLFDGASLFLYVCGLTVYITNIVKGLRVVQDGSYGQEELVEGENVLKRSSTPSPNGGPGDGAISREDSLRVLSASHTILALVLIGVLVLQAGQWYAERKDEQEFLQRMATSSSSSSSSSSKRGSGPGGQASHSSNAQVGQGSEVASSLSSTIPAASGGGIRGGGSSTGSLPVAGGSMDGDTIGVGKRRGKQ